MNKYPIEVEKIMKTLFSLLPEHQKHRYAAVEVQKLGPLGKKYICDLFECDLKTLNLGIEELENEYSTNDYSDIHHLVHYIKRNYVLDTEVRDGRTLYKKI